MKRNAKLPEIRKQELITAALKLFYANGYEKTSIRDILDEVGGEVGMFYHYFKSKDEIFELAVELFLNDYVADFSEISSYDSKSFQQRLDSLIILQSEAIIKYKNIWSDKIHWSMASAIYKKTLERLIPYVEVLISTATNNNEISLKTENINIHEITLFLIYGISGVLHEKPLAGLTPTELMKKQQDIRNLIAQFLMIKE
jgi:AcrR family transcriptional regulator